MSFMCECCGGDCKLCGKEMEEKDVFQAYKEISDKFDMFTQMMRARHASIGYALIGDSINLNPTMKPPEFIPIPDYTPGVAPDSKMYEAILNRIQDIGRAQEKLKSILDEDILEQHSKHDPYWHTDDLEIANDRLHDLRCKLNCLSDNLWDLWTILRKEEEL